MDGTLVLFIFFRDQFNLVLNSNNGDYLYFEVVVTNRRNVFVIIILESLLSEVQFYIYILRRSICKCNVLPKSFRTR